MTLVRRSIQSILLIATTMLAACAARTPVTQVLEADELFAYGVQRLEARRWSDAVEAFEAFTFRFPTHRRQAEARLHLAEARFGNREFLAAAVEFIRVAREGPNAPWADRARFRACESYYRLAPAPQRDQQYSVAAIEHCDALVSYFPDSEFVPQAREIMAELYERLATKQFNVGEHYFRRRAYDAAILSYNDVIELYPATDTAPRALLRLIDVYDRLGYEPEREATRERLLREYPASAEAGQVRERTAANRP